MDSEGFSRAGWKPVRPKELGSIIEEEEGEEGQDRSQEMAVEEKEIEEEGRRAVGVPGR